MTKLPLIGGCACGTLRYEVSAAPVAVYNCHCTSCQKISGAAFNTAVTVIESALRFTQGEPARTEWTADSGVTRWGWFCRDCGTRIANGQTPSRGALSLRSGTLDDTGWVYPAGDTWTRSAQLWVRFVEGGLRFEKGPEDYAPLAAAFMAQGRF